METWAEPGLLPAVGLLPLELHVVPLLKLQGLLRMLLFQMLHPCSIGRQWPQMLMVQILPLLQCLPFLFLLRE